MADPVLVLDGSNYTDKPFTPDICKALWSLGVRLVMIQALIPPAGYPEGKTQQQLSSLLDWGMPAGFYTFWWAGAGIDYLKRQMTTLEGFERKLFCAGGDYEDTSVAALRTETRSLFLPKNHLARIGRQPPPEKRLITATLNSSAGLWADIQAWQQYMRTYPVINNIDLYYSGPWYWRPYLGNPDIAHLPNSYWWTSDFDLNPDPTVLQGTWGGMQPPADMKQYTSGSFGGLSGIDLSVAGPRIVGLLSQPVTPDVDPQTQRINDLQGALGWVTVNQQQALRDIDPDQLEQHEMKKEIDSVADELQRIHDQFIPE